MNREVSITTNQSNLTGEATFTGTNFSEKKVPAMYTGLEQLDGQPVTEPGTPVQGNYLPISESLGLFEPIDSTQIFEVSPDDIAILPVPVETGVEGATTAVAA